MCRGVSAWREIEDYAKKVALQNAMTAQSELTKDDITERDKKIKSGVQQHSMNKAARSTGRKPDSS